MVTHPEEGKTVYPGYVGCVGGLNGVRSLGSIFSELGGVLEV